MNRCPANLCRYFSPFRFNATGGKILVSFRQYSRLVQQTSTLRSSYLVGDGKWSNSRTVAKLQHTWRNIRDATSNFHTSSVNCHGEYEWQDPKSEDEVVNVEVADKEGNVFKIKGKIGDNLLYLSKRFEVEMEGACEASLACTTCHVYVNHDYLDLLPEATETEEDLLDQAPFLKENSRLGCQIILTKELEGIKLTLPAATKNFYVDGHKPTPH